jgi:hypothetical protein
VDAAQHQLTWDELAHEEPDLREWCADRWLGAWGRFQEVSYWWMHAMVLVWGLFMLMLFVLEPLWLHRSFERSAQTRPDATFKLIQRLHWVLLIVSLLTVAGAVAAESRRCDRHSRRCPGCARGRPQNPSRNPAPRRRAF